MTLLLAVAALRLTTVRDTSGVLVMYEPLYPPDGAPLRAFRCKAADCGRVTRTERGMKAHCWLVHHTKLQLELFYDKRETATPKDRWAYSAARRRRYRRSGRNRPSR